MAKKNRYYAKAERLYDKADRAYAKSFDSEYYARMDNRRMLEDQDMIHEDHSAMANMPTKAIMRPYESREAGLDITWEDGGKGAQKQLKRLHNDIMKNVHRP